MTTIVTTRLVKIGNSQGIRIPKILLEQVGLSGEVQIEVEADRLILRSVTGRRREWDKQFLQMTELGDDRLLDGDALLPTKWEDKEWEW